MMATPTQTESTQTELTQTESTPAEETPTTLTTQIFDGASQMLMGAGTIFVATTCGIQMLATQSVPHMRVAVGVAGHVAGKALDTAALVAVSTVEVVTVAMMNKVAVITDDMSSDMFTKGKVVVAWVDQKRP